MQPGEAEAYRAAYALVQGQQFEQAIPRFSSLCRPFPDGQYAPNAHYWLGELYLVKQPPDLEAARQSFALLLSQYPDNQQSARCPVQTGQSAVPEGQSGEGQGVPGPGDYPIRGHAMTPSSNWPGIS